MELVTGRTGTPHVTSQQFRGIMESVFGVDSYLAEVYDKFAYTIAPNNTIQIQSGILIHHGGVFLVPNGSIDEVQYQNGTQGMKRIDLIVARYTKDADQNTESAAWVVIQGEETSGTPVAPAYTEGNMQNGDLVDDCPVYALYYDGLNIESVELLVPYVNLGGGGTVPLTFTDYQKPTPVKSGITLNSGGYVMAGNLVFVELSVSKEGTWSTSLINKEDALSGFPVPIGPVSWVEGYHVKASAGANAAVIAAGTISSTGVLSVSVPDGSTAKYSTFLSGVYLASL